MVATPESLTSLNAEQLRELARDLIAKVARQGQQITQHDQQISELDLQIASLDQAISNKDREILYRQAKIDQLTHEMAVLKRWKFGRSREQLDAAQTSFLDETIDADIAAIEQELQDLAPAAKTPEFDSSQLRTGLALNKIKDLEAYFGNYCNGTFCLFCKMLTLVFCELIVVACSSKSPTPAHAVMSS